MIASRKFYRWLSRTSDRQSGSYVEPGRNVRIADKPFTKSFTGVDGWAVVSARDVSQIDEAPD
jgi:hypothetical protein